MKHVRVAFFGGTGYVGSALRAHFSLKGIPVVVFSSRTPTVLYPSEMYAKADPWTAQLAQGEFTHVIDLYGMSGDARCARDPHDAKHRNVDSVQALILAATKAHIPRFIFASTASVFDDGKQDTGEEHGEHDVPNPMSVYGKTKREAEMALLSQERMDVTIIRHPTIYGFSPCMRWDTFMQFCLQQAKRKHVMEVLGDGSAYRPLTALPHVVEGYAHAVTHTLSSKTILHLVTENETIKTYLGRISSVAKEFGCDVQMSHASLPYVASYRVRNSFPFTVSLEASKNLLRTLWKTDEIA